MNAAKAKVVRRGQNSTLCPHCSSPCKSVKARQLAPTYREVTYVCTNDACGHVFVGSIVPVRTLEPSATPDPDVRIPMPAERSAQWRRSPCCASPRSSTPFSARPANAPPAVASGPDFNQ